jgi:hypothetical protein
MKTPKTSSNRRIVIALLAATVVTVTMAVVPVSVVKPAYAQLDDIISGEQIVGEEIEIPDSDAIREKVEEITSSQSVPRLAELGIILLGGRPPPALAD